MARGTPVNVWMLSAPSTRTSVFSSDWPPNDKRGAAAAPTPASGSLNAPPPIFSRPGATPLESLAKSTKLRPMIGSDSIDCWLMTRLTSALLSSISGSSALTSTTSLTFPTCTVKSSVAPPPIVNVTLLCAVLNPTRSARTSYWPGPRLVRL